MTASVLDLNLDDVHDLESVGGILRRLRAECEAKMTSDFNPHLSLLIDALVEQEDAI